MKVRDDGESDEKKEKREKKERKDGKEKKVKKPKKGSNAGSGDDDQEDTVQEYGLLKKSQSTEISTNQSEDDEGEADKKSKKRRNRKDKGSSGGCQLEELEELEYKSPEVVNVVQNLLNLISYGDESGKIIFNQSVSPNDFFDRLRLLQMSQGFNHRLKVYIALEALCHPDLGGLTPNILENRSQYLLMVGSIGQDPFRYPIYERHFFRLRSCTEWIDVLYIHMVCLHGGCRFFLPQITQNMSHRDILAALEDFVMNQTEISVPDGFKNYPYFVQKLYSADILTDEGILKYYSSRKVEAEKRESYSKAKLAVKPFLDWLEQSDSEEDTDNDDNESTNGTSSPYNTKSLGTVAPVVGIQKSTVALKSKTTDISYVL